MVKGGLVLMDPDTSTVQSVIALQYNPDSLTRTLQIQAVQGGQDGVRVDALRLWGPAIETIKLEAELDATDQLEFPSQYPNAVKYGLHPQLAQLEMLVNPTVETLLAMVAAIDQTPTLSKETKAAMAWQLHIELFRDLGLKPGSKFQLPYKNIPKD